MRRTIARAVAIVVVVVIAAFTYPGAILVSISVHRTPAIMPSAFPVTPGGLEWLHVEHAPDMTPFIADQQGPRHPGGNPGSRTAQNRGRLPRTLMLIPSQAPWGKV